MSWKLFSYIAGLVVAVILLTWGLLSFDFFGRRKAAEARATTAEQQVKVETAATQAVEQVHRVEVVTRQIAQEAIEHVQQAEGADAPLPPAVADAVRRSVDGMRQRSEAGEHQPAEPAEGAVPPR